MILNIISVFILILVIILLASFGLSNIILKPRVVKNEKLFELELEKGRIKEQFYKNCLKRDFIIKSRYGYDLSCELLDNDISKDQFVKPNKVIKVAIICHGYTRGKYSSIMYAELFLKRGITVLIYDHRNHGLSGKAYTTMGYYESYDLQTVVDWCYKEFGPNLAIVTHGESMGAATVLSHLAIDKRVSCVIADCPYANLMNLIKYQIKKYYHLPKFPFLYIARFIIKLRAGFWIDNVAPIECVKSSKVPILFIHGLLDDYVPYTMSKEMYDAKLDQKEIYLAPNAKHASSCQKNPNEYEIVFNNFLNHYF
ncbi:MAG: hypothetical protein K0S41_3862 [Anaerocolumna sp.]|jgi:fermentation-respiration switch protein FrsA (DUF1100 family)|nr:hypothetical protein [Anaerocolumna sp.]